MTGIASKTAAGLVCVCVMCVAPPATLGVDVPAEPAKTRISYRWQFAPTSDFYPIYLKHGIVSGPIVPFLNGCGRQVRIE